MGSQRLVALVGAMTIAIAGCASEDTTTPTASSPSPDPAVTTPIPPVSRAPVAQPLVVQKKQSNRVVAGLIQPTNSEERAKQVESEIRNSESRNPFVGLPPHYPSRQLMLQNQFPVSQNCPKQALLEPEHNPQSQQTARQTARSHGVL